MKNLLILHLESISNQTLKAFPNSFPATRSLMARSLGFRNFFSSATSSLMALAAVWHGNSFELDYAPTLANVMPAGLSSNLFSVLQDRGYNCSTLCLNMNHPESGTRICIWPEELEPVWGTDSPSELISRFDAISDQPFAVYVWNLVTHVEQHDPQSDSMASLAQRLENKYQQADQLTGELVALLEKKDLLDNTVVILMGDHGDDFWTHGFKGGFLHAIEPYAGITSVPLSISVPHTAPTVYSVPASTIDIRNTVLALLGCTVGDSFADMGINLLDQKNSMVFSQNLLANQVATPSPSISKAYAAMNESYLLLVGKNGLEFFEHRLDPANCCNLLHFFSLGAGGELHFSAHDFSVPHFDEIFRRHPANLRHINDNFMELRTGLCAFVQKKNTYAAEENMLPLSCLNIISRKGAEDFSFADLHTKKTFFAKAKGTLWRYGRRVLGR